MLKPNQIKPKINQQKKRSFNGVIGNSKSENVQIKRAIRRFHFCVGNFHSDTSIDEIHEYVSNFATKLLSVDEIELKHSYYKVFKVCVEDTNEQEMLNPANWLDGIRVRRFHFNKKGITDTNPTTSNSNQVIKPSTSTTKESTITAKGCTSAEKDSNKTDNLIEMND